LIYRIKKHTLKLNNTTSNEELQKDVQAAMKREPLLHAAEIGVPAHDGVVTLTGTVDSYVKNRKLSMRQRMSLAF
jgi:osmotically-inducible protein OsmY